MKRLVKTNEQSSINYFQRIWRHAWPVLWYVFLAIIWTWPLAQEITTSLPGQGGDPLLQSWIMAWNAHALLNNPSRLWDAPIFYPYASVVTFHDHLILLTVLVLPLLVIDQLALAFNVALMLSLAINGWAVFLLTKSLIFPNKRGVIASFCALLSGSLFAFNTYHMQHITHLNLLQTGWLPLALCWLYQLSVARDGIFWRAAFLTGFFAGLQAIAAVYYAPMTMFVLGVAGVVWFFPTSPLNVRAWKEASQRIIGIIIAALVAALMSLPFFLPYIATYQWLGIVRSPIELEIWSAPIQSFVSAPSQNLMVKFNPLVQSMPDAERNLFPGFVSMMLGIVGIWFLRKNNQRVLIALLLILVSGVIFSLGTVLRTSATSEPILRSMPYQWLYDWVPGMKALRVPARWWMIGSLAIALFAGAGLFALAQLIRRWVNSPHWLVVILAAFALLEHLAIPINRVVLRPIPPVYEWLIETFSGQQRVLLELPLSDKLDYQIAEQLAWRQYYQTRHWQPIISGYSGLFPTGSLNLWKQIAQLPDDRILGSIALLGCDTIIIHQREFTDQNYLATLLEWADHTPLLNRIAQIDDAIVYTVAVDLIPPPIGAVGDRVFLSDNAQIADLVALAFQRRWTDAGAIVYGNERIGYYPRQRQLPPGVVFDYVALAADEDIRLFGVTPEHLLWHGEGMSIYAVPDGLLANVALGAPDLGQFHPRYPEQINVTIGNDHLQIDRTKVPLFKSTDEDEMVLLVYLVSLIDQEINVNDRTYRIVPGSQTLSIPTRGRATFTVAGQKGMTGIMRVQAWRDHPQLAEMISPAIAVETAFTASQLTFQVRAVGVESLYIHIQGAQDGNERPVYLARGPISVSPEGSVQVTLDVLAPKATWLEQATIAVDGRYIVYLQREPELAATGIPIAKFNVYRGKVEDMVPLRVPLTELR